MPRFPTTFPGVGGCTAAARLPDDYGMPGRIAALRVDVGTGRAMTAHLGPATDQRANEGDSRSSWELTWELPSADEFVAPTDPQPDPNEVGSTATPPPTPTPIPVGTDAWQPVALPMSPALEEATSVAMADVVPRRPLGRCRLRVRGRGHRSRRSGHRTTASRGRASTSPTRMGDLSPSGIGWNGREYLMIGVPRPRDRGAGVGLLPAGVVDLDRTA